MQFYKAVYYSEYIIIILVKVLFGLLLFLSALNGSDCLNFFQKLEGGITNYVHNSEFPYKYKGENNYTWKITDSDVFEVNCSLEMVNLLYKCWKFTHV